MPEGVRVSGNLRKKFSESGQEHGFPKARPCQPLGPPLLWGARSEQPFLKAAMVVEDGVARHWAILWDARAGWGFHSAPPGRLLPHWSMVCSPGPTGYPLLPQLLSHGWSAPAPAPSPPALALVSCSPFKTRPLCHPVLGWGRVPWASCPTLFSLSWTEGGGALAEPGPVSPQTECLSQGRSRMTRGSLRCLTRRAKGR